ncbi:MAG TPA: ATP-binding protein [Candidatus Paceibacterota bacterium]|nr:ATP-binding protein [Candidatus Paceibacterota bacterium]
MKTLSQSETIIDVATGEVKSAKAPARLQCLAVGSCVAVILYDEEKKIGGIAHVMLPSYIENKENIGDAEALKHANTAIHELIKQVRELGSPIGRSLTARLVGGAYLIPNTSDIGKENIAAVQKILLELGIAVTDEYIGGDAGRSVLFDVATGELEINGKIKVSTVATSYLSETKGSPLSHDDEVERLEASLAKQNIELIDRIKEIDNTRGATINLLEDLTVEKEALEIGRAKEAAILFSIGDGIIATDANRRIIIMNKVAENLLGWKIDEAIGKLYSNVVTLEDEKGTFIPVEEPIYKAFKEGTTTSDIKTTSGLYLVGKNKTKVPVAITVSPVIWGSKIIGAVEVFRDVTEEKAIDKAKTEFVSLASHQLRTPLTAISWYTEMVLNEDVGKITPEQKKYLEQIYRGNQRMVELVNTLLDVSRIEMGTFAVDLKLIDVIEIARNVFSEQTLEILQKELKIKEDFGKDIPKFMADAKLFGIVFQNLISNAIKYTPVGGTIEFSISMDKKNILTKITDTGYGIPEKQQSKIFSKLFRADNVLDKDTTGTGLGLYIAKSVVENSGGKIWFESKENAGTTFYVTIPMYSVKKGTVKVPD